MKKGIVIRNVDQMSIRNLIMALFILNFDKIFAFQAVASGYAVFISRNNTKVVNDTPNGIKNDILLQ